MAAPTKLEADTNTDTTTSPATSSNGFIEASESASKAAKAKSRNRNKDAAVSASVKRRCVSTACIACRRRKSKCDGNTPSCAACASVYGTECIYDPNSDHRRKGVYKKDIDNLKTRNSTLQTLIQAILNYSEEEVVDLVRQIRTCESLDDVAETILAKDSGLGEEEEETESPSYDNGSLAEVPKFETELSGKMGEMRLENGSVSFIGGTSNLIFLESGLDEDDMAMSPSSAEQYQQQDNPFTSWTTVTSDPELIIHLINMYFSWHYTYFTTLSKSLFYRDFLLGRPPQDTRRKTEYCTPLLVNAMLAIGCHFTSWPAARADPQDSATAGDHFFREAKRLILENDEHENPRLSTVQALALMSVREAGCGREAKGWVYSGMSFRMACDLGLNVDSGNANRDELEVDARRITFWGCFLFDKCWSNYLGRQPQLPLSSVTVPKFDVFPMEDADLWYPYTDTGMTQGRSQPSRTRAVALQISSLCEISSDLLLYFYHPTNVEKPIGKQAELKKLGELHTRLEAWRKNLPKEMDPKEGQLSSVLVMHMFFQLLFIHLFRPFLKYNQSTSPLPAHVSPRKLCTHAAAMVSKLLRLYKRTHGLRQICNIAVYIAHSACTIHLLNLPEKNAKRDIIHGVKHLEEIAEGWLCARRTLSMLSMLTRRWKIEVPEEAAIVLARTDAKFGALRPYSHTSPGPEVIPLASNRQTSPANQAAMKRDPGLNMAAPALPDIIAMSSPPSVPKMRLPNGPSALPSRIPADYGHAPRQQRYVMPQEQQELWNQDRAARVGAMAEAQPAPAVLFGGVEALVEESQDWWVRDQSVLAMGFNNWTGLESEAALLGNGANGTGYTGYVGANSFGANGANGGHLYQ